MPKKRVFLGIGFAAVLAFSLSLCACGDEPYSGLDYDDYVKVGQYKGLTIEPVGEIKVTDDEVKERIDESLEAAGSTKELTKDDEIEKGDTVNIDYKGKIDGKEFEGGSAEGTDLEIGSGSFIDGFEDGLIGKHVGDKVTLEVTFPEDYQGKEVAGKDATFDVTINSAKRTEVPEYTDEYVKKNTEFKSKDEYEDSVRKALKKEKETEAADNQKAQLWSQVLENSEVKKYPEEELKHYEEVFDAQVDTMAEQYGVDRSEIIAQYFGASDEESYKKMIKESSEMLVKQELVVESIADQENLEYTDKEKEAKQKEVEEQGYDDETVQAYTGRTMDQYVHISLLYDKVMDFIVDNAKIEKKDSKDKDKDKEDKEDKEDAEDAEE